jgi:hypothetical protein
MQLPKHNRNYQTQVDYGRYVAARLRQAKKDDLAQGVEQASQAVKDKGRSWQDLSEAVSGDLARRDAADEALDAVAQDFRLNLASRGVGADKQAPYTSIFPKGVAYYTAAPLGENPARYKELLTRAGAALPASDTALSSILSGLPTLIANFQQAVAALDSARAQAGVARTALESSVDDWLVQMEKTYGVLAAELTRKGADRFFPRPSTPVVDEPPTPEPTVA